MISTKPYLMRAIYEWCVDQGFTPYLQVAVDAQTRVPREHVRDGQIVLNVGPDATHQFIIGNEDVTFQARFNGKAFPVFVPVNAVVAIYARENGQGMAFEVEKSAPEGETPASDIAADSLSQVEVAPAIDTDSEPDPGAPNRPARSHLTRVK
ncbi:MAG: ClpXP protease specificity-enhancing factor [Rhodocyclaceae bacterium]|nr:MAG: ClpXP protease specificity-enhancing factor [Rhodocyclaceae bacterium]